ncbi:MAG: hypothetical protein WCJ30_17500, partial [Deltaproteobacteria bacterium]
TSVAASAPSSAMSLTSMMPVPGAPVLPLSDSEWSGGAGMARVLDAIAMVSRPTRPRENNDEESTID